MTQSTGGRGWEGGGCGGGGQVNCFARKLDPFLWIFTAAAGGVDEGDEVTADEAAGRQSSGGAVDGAGGAGGTAGGAGRTATGEQKWGREVETRRWEVGGQFHSGEIR
jgi:hypothetical protein